MSSSRHYERGRWNRELRSEEERSPFDRNQDGRLSPEEYRAMRRFQRELEKWWRSGRNGPPPLLPR